MWLYLRVMSPNDADGMTNSVDPDQTAHLGAVWSGSALFAEAYLSENLGSGTQRKPISFGNLTNFIRTFILHNFIYTVRNKKKTSSFESNENIQKKEDESYYVVLANKASSVPCNDPATKARGNILQFCEFQIGSRFKHWYKSKWGPNN